MMNQQLIFLPCLLLILLTGIVLKIMFSRRMESLKNGDITPSYFKTYSTGQTESIKSIQAQRNFTNLHEAPIIFYTLCLMTYVTSNVNELTIGLAWGFFVLRLIHSIVHLTTNKLKIRMLSFGAGWLVIVVMSVFLLYKII